MLKNITILKTFKSNQETCPTHLTSIWNDDPKACFKNAIEKKAFTEKRALNHDDYIMYMCSDDSYDHFKSKTTKSKWKVKRATKHAQSTGSNGHSYVNA